MGALPHPQSESRSKGLLRRFDIQSASPGLQVPAQQQAWISAAFGLHIASTQAPGSLLASKTHRAHQAASGYTTHAPHLQRCEPTNKTQRGAPVLAKLHGSIAPEKCSEGGWQFTALQYRGRKAPSSPSNARFFERAVILQSSSTAVRCPRPRSHRPAVSPFLVRTAAAKPRAPSCSCHSFKWYMLQRQQAPLGAGDARPRGSWPARGGRQIVQLSPPM